MLSEENMSKIGYYCVGVGGVLLGVANDRNSSLDNKARNAELGGWLIAIGQYFKYKAHKKLD